MVCHLLTSQISEKTSGPEEAMQRAAAPLRGRAYKRIITLLTADLYSSCSSLVQDASSFSGALSGASSRLLYTQEL